MIIINQTTQKHILGFVAPHGKTLPAGVNEELTIPDHYASHPSLQNMVSEGTITIGNFEVNDSISQKTAFDDDLEDKVSAFEWNRVMEGLYSLPDAPSRTETGTAQASAVGTFIVNGAAGPYDLTLKNVLKLNFDSVASRTATITFDKGQYNATQVVAALTANTDFAKFATATVASSKVKITSKVIGANSKVEVDTTPVGSCHVELKLDAGDITETADDKTVQTVTFVVNDISGNPIVGSKQTIAIYNEDAGSGNTKSEEFILQRVSVGEEISGGGTDTIVARSGKDGKITFEVAAPSTISETELHVEVEIPAGHVLAQKPAARFQILGA